jgi:hypothetical protein
VADIYKQIISDLKAAAAVLPDVFQQSQRGRATKWAATHLLAKVYLTRISADVSTRGGKTTDLDSAAIYAEQVINSGKFALEPNFANVFEQNNQKVTKEIIWDVEYTKIPFSAGPAVRAQTVAITSLIRVTQYDVNRHIRDIANAVRETPSPEPTYHKTTYDPQKRSRFYNNLKWLRICNNATTAATNVLERQTTLYRSGNQARS